MKRLIYFFAIITLYCIATSCNRDDKPITLSSNKTEIIADGEDIATFTVLCEGKDVTDESTFFLEGQDGEFGSSFFSTSEAKS